MFILKEVMSELNVTSQLLSERTGIPKRTIDEYRSKRRKEPSLSNGLKIADALGIDPHELIQFCSCGQPGGEVLGEENQR